MLLKLAMVLFVTYGVRRMETVQTPNDEMSDYDNFLRRYGYLEELPAAISKDVISAADIRKRRDTAIIAYQLYYGVPLTGKLDKKTRELMSKPRCGVSDIIKKNAGQRQKRRQFPLSFTHLGTRWPNSRLTWKINSYTMQLRRAEQRATFSKAFKIWEDVTALKIDETSGKADMDISFERYDHGDGSLSAFDGKGNVLAHAFGPGTGDISGDIHFDDDEEWTLNSDRGSDLYVAAAHEFGHSLGLGHSNQPNALMYPIYKKSEDLSLDYDDIRGIQELYGSRIGPNERPETRKFTARPRPRPRFTNRRRLFPTTPPPPATTTQSDPCNIDIDQIVEGEEGLYYIFENDAVHTVQGERLHHEVRPVGDVFESAPAKPDMAFTTPYKDKIYIVKDSAVWRYTSLQLDEGFPKSIDNHHFPEKPKFVLSFIDDFSRTRNLIFGATKWWEYDFDEPNLYTLNFFDIGNHFLNMPRNIKFSVQQSESHLFYLISENRYYVLNTKRRTLEKDGGNDGLPPWIEKACNIIQLNSAGMTNVSIASMVTSLVYFLFSVGNL